MKKPNDICYLYIHKHKKILLKYTCALECFLMVFPPAIFSSSLSSFPFLNWECILLWLVYVNFTLISALLAQLSHRNSTLISSRYIVWGNRRSNVTCNVWSLTILLEEQSWQLLHQIFFELQWKSLLLIIQQMSQNKNKCQTQSECRWDGCYDSIWVNITSYFTWLLRQGTKV